MFKRMLMNSFRRHKGIALMTLMYYFFSLGKKKLRENAAPENPLSRKRNSERRR